MTRDRLLAAVLVSLLGLAAVSCGDDEGETLSSATVLADGSNGEPRRVEVRHVGGVTEIEGVPERIVALAPLPVENCLALGVKPVAVTAFSRGGASQPYLKYPPYLAKELEGTPIVGSRTEPNVEAILARDPDLILGVDEQMPTYDAVSRAAPAVYFSQDNDRHDKDRQSWRRCLLTLGAILDREEKARERLREYDEAAREAGEEIRARIGDDTVLLVRTLAKGLRVHGPSHGTMGHILYTDLGLGRPEGLLEEWPEVYVPMEKLVEMDPDHILMIRGNPELTRSLVEGPVWSRLRAVRAGHVHEVDLYWIRGHGWYGKMAIVADARRLLGGGH